jgi:ATP-binding cassette, subfamily C, bacterial CydD
MSGRGGVLQPDLLKRFPMLRRFLMARAVSAGLSAVLTVAQVLAVAHVLGTSEVHRADVVTLVVVVAGRSLLAWWDRWSAEATAIEWKRRLRGDTAKAVRVGGIRGQTASGALTTLLTKGLDTLDGYVTGPLAALPDAVVAPLAVVGTLFVLDWPSALIVLVTLPAVPALLALVGLYTRERTQHQMSALLRLGTQFLEAVSGLVTLRLLGRQNRTSERVRESAEEYRLAMVRTLRLAFLSSFVLESLTSLAVALIAVPVGFRLLDGRMTLVTGLAVLMLTPEAYRALRVLGTQFHAAQDTQVVLDELEELARGGRAVRRAVPARSERAVPAPDPAAEPVRLCGLTVGFDKPVLSEVSLVLMPGRRYAVTGPSGAGKSTLLRTVAGLLPPLSGVIRVGEKDLRDVDPDAWNLRLAMVPQRPHLFHGTVADNIRLGCPGVGLDGIWHALEQAGASDFVHRMPGRLDARIGDRGTALSAGERQRLALARALAREPALLLLDEPTARMDGETERCVLTALDRIGTAATVVVVTHRPQVAERADAVIEIADGRALLALRDDDRVRHR